MHWTLGIIGGGRAAWAFGSTWRRIGWPVAGVVLRDGSPSALPSHLDAPRRSVDELAQECDLLLLAVTDAAIQPLARELPQTRSILFHASGATPSVRGGFSLHPLRALPPVGEPVDLAGTLLVFEGEHRDVGQAIADAAGARLIGITAAEKPLYHAAAVFASNYVASLLDISSELLGRVGIEEAREELALLAESAIENWAAHRDRRRFTGPAARGDRAVMESHLAALRNDPQLLQLYELLARHITASILASSK